MLEEFTEMLMWSSAAQDKAAVTCVTYCALAALEDKEHGGLLSQHKTSTGSSSVLQNYHLGLLTDGKLSFEWVMIHWIKYQAPFFSSTPLVL